jgi:hypothetical protein
VIRISGNESVTALAKFDRRTRFGIETKFGFTIGGVRTVAGETFVGKDGAYVSVELDGFGLRLEEADI